MKLFLFLLFFPVLVFSQKIDSILKKQEIFELQIKVLNEKQSRLESFFDRDQTVDNKAYTSISNQLSSSANALAFFGFIFGILSVGLGLYVTYVERKITKIADSNLKLLNETRKVKNEVVVINEMIQNDIKGLYKKIKREETLHILDRLTKVPKDVSNLIDELLSRDLEKNDFEKLKYCFSKLPENEGDTYRDKYKMIIFQHFADLALEDCSFRESFIPYIKDGVQYCFENDILKATNEIFEYLVNNGLENNIEIINNYFSGLELVTYKDWDEIYNLIVQKLSTRNNHFLLAQLINNETAQFSKYKYGSLILEKYSENDLSETERIVKDQIENLKNINEDEENETPELGNA